MFPRLDIFFKCRHGFCSMKPHSSKLYFVFFFSRQKIPFYNRFFFNISKLISHLRPNAQHTFKALLVNERLSTGLHLYQTVEYSYLCFQPTQICVYVVPLFLEYGEIRDIHFKSCYHRYFFIICPLLSLFLILPFLKKSCHKYIMTIYSLYPAICVQSKRHLINQSFHLSYIRPH